MSDTVKPKKRWFLKAELVILVCLACFWTFKSGTVDIDGVKAGVLGQVVKIDPDNIDAHRFLADYYDYSDHYEEAIEAYRQVVRIDPNDAEARHNLGNAYASSGRYVKAIEHFKEAVRIRPDSTWAHVCLGFNYSDLGRCEEAVETYMQIIKLDPDVADATYLLIGNAYTTSGRYEEAAEAYKQAIEIDADMAQAHYHLAEVYLKMGDKDLALEEYEILKTLDEELANELLGLLQQQDLM